MEDEDPAAKRALSSFQGAIINQIKCSVCETVSSSKEDFYHLTIPLPKSGKVLIHACRASKKGSTL